MTRSASRNPFRGLRRALRLRWLRFLRIREGTLRLARGAACGVFGGCLPFLPGLPLQMVVAVALALALRGSKAAALAATFISNPFNWWLFYLVQYRLGRLVMPLKEADAAALRALMRDCERVLALVLSGREGWYDSAMTILQGWRGEGFLAVGWHGVALLMAGGAVLGAPLALVAYVAVRRTAENYRSRCLFRERCRLGGLQAGEGGDDRA